MTLNEKLFQFLRMHKIIDIMIKIDILTILLLIIKIDRLGILIMYSNIYLLKKSLNT